MGALHTVTEQAHGNQFPTGGICASSQNQATAVGAVASGFNIMGCQEGNKGLFVHDLHTQAFSLGEL